MFIAMYNCVILPSVQINSRNSAECFWEIGISPTAHTSAQTSARMAWAVVFRLRLIPIQETRQSFSAVLYTISTVLTSQRLRLYIKMRVTLHSHSFLVGVARLVSRAPCLRKCARRNSDCCTADRVSVCFCRATSWDKKARANCPCFLSGRSGETWTRGLTVPNRTRYQTALHPD